ncbi:hypothetical protein ECP03047993_5467 [Escherichia coli P0304799.3]|nr:hypothetical protein ECP03047993_5467 [Escherichia coli P0304799.3]
MEDALAELMSRYWGILPRRRTASNCDTLLIGTCCLNNVEPEK